MAYGPKVVLPNLSHGGLQLLQSGRVVPKNVFPAISQSIVLDHHLFLFLCYLNQTFGLKTIFTDYLLNAKVSRISLPQITIPSQFPDITMLKSNRHFKMYHPKGNFWYLPLILFHPVAISGICSVAQSNIWRWSCIFFLHPSIYQQILSIINPYNTLNTTTFLQLQCFAPGLESHYLSIVMQQRLYSSSNLPLAYLQFNV